MFDIITFGSATRDIFLRAKQFLIGDFKPDKHNEKEILLPYGLKVNIEDIHFRSGGGGTNTAATFSKQGFKIAYCGVIGKDPEGEQILKELKEKRIGTEFITRTDKKLTNLSIIFSSPKERTILVFRGASKYQTKKDIPWARVKKTKWFYLAPFSKGTGELFGEVLNFAKKNGIRTMVNPGSPLLSLPSKRFIPLLKKIDILLLNQEEAQILVKSKKIKGKELLLKIKRFFPGILIITNGSERAFIVKGSKIFSAMPFNAKIVDKTGAGDAFGAGFLSGYIKSKGNVVYATQLAVANSVSCLKKWGAKEGILNKKQTFKKVKVNIHESS